MGERGAMIGIREKYNVLFTQLLIIFIALQPILDVFTTITIQFIDTTITFGIIIRLLVMLLAILYIVTHTNAFLKRIASLYLASIFVIVAIGFMTGFFLKPNFQFFSEVQYYAKGVYFLVMFTSYTMALVSLKEIFRKKLVNTVLKPIVIAMTIVGIVYILAILTGTGLDTYRYVKAGTKAWFNAGNEIGAILSICLPVVLLYGIKSTSKVTQLHYWIPALLVIFSLIMLGTKVGYLSIIASLVIAISILLINVITNDEQKNFKPSLWMIGVIFATVAILTPYTPAFSNTEAHIRIIDEKNVAGETPLEEITADESGAGTNLITSYSNKVVSVILSSRQIFLKDTHQMYVEAPMIQKLFGMGYAGNYQDSPKLIEMDFLDLFYSFGLLGFVLYMLPFLYAFIGLIRGLKWRQLFEVELGFVITSLLIGVGIAFIAGHVLFAPAVSIYLAVLLAYTYAEFDLVKN
jgi:hypothetical protein